MFRGRCSEPTTPLAKFNHSGMSSSQSFTMKTRRHGCTRSSGATCHDFDGLFPNLPDMVFNGLLRVAIGHSVLWNQLGDVSSFLSNPRNWQVNDVLHCVVLHTLRWNVLHDFSGFLHHLSNRDIDAFFNDALLNSFSRHRRAWVPVSASRGGRPPLDQEIEHVALQPYSALLERWELGLASQPARQWS